MDFNADYKLEGDFMNLRYADDIILFATLEAELQELVDTIRYGRLTCAQKMTR